MTQTGSISSNDAGASAGPGGSDFPSLTPFEPPPPNNALPNEAVPNDAQSTPVDISESWADLRANPDIQFEEIPVAPPPPPEPPSEPGWFGEMMVAFFQFLGEIFGPIGAFIGAAWPVLQWVLLAAVVGFVIYLILRLVGPLSGRNAKDKKAMSEPEWQPDREESIALLDDADKLAAEGKYDEAVHLLLKRSVRQIADARPDWVEPSSTARELAALPELSEKARTAFSTISERVERSLFALRALDASDWEAARSAYANFALARIVAPENQTAEIERARGFGRKVTA